MAIEDLGPAERLAAGALGEPGERRFFIQITANGVDTWLAAEKDQIGSLALQCLELIQSAELTVDREAVERIVEAGLEIAEPAATRFRLSSISITVPDSSLLRVAFESAEGDGVSLAVAPEQLSAMALVGMEVVAAGRPLCPWCRLPIDPDGHLCAASNGHHPRV
jgi:hypothetical protein